MSTKVCAYCKKKPSTPRGLYCSPKCRVAGNRAKTTKPVAKVKSKAKAVTSHIVEEVPDYHLPEENIDNGAIEGDKSVTTIIDTGTGEIEEYDVEKNMAAFRKMGLSPVEWITTGIPEFDELTKIPKGRVTQIQGPFAVGKTTLCLNMLKGLRKKRVLYIDTEAALNAQILTNLGIDADTFRLYNDSAFIEDIYDVVLRALEKPQFDIIILDSLAACTFRTEAAGDAPDANIGQKAKIVNKLMRIVPMELKRTGTALVIINQERETIGGYGPIKYTPGGMGVLYAASLIVSLKTTKAQRFPVSGPPYKGHEITAEIIKSKVNDPWRKAQFKLHYGGQRA